MEDTALGEKKISTWAFRECDVIVKSGYNPNMLYGLQKEKTTAG